MARRREPEPVQRATGDVTVPPELAVGACVELWGDAVPLYGPLHDAAMARFRYADAARVWERSVGIGPYEHDRRLPRSLDLPRGATFADRLAAVGCTTDDLPRLRRAVEARTRTEHRRTT